MVSRSRAARSTAAYTNGGSGSMSPQAAAAFAALQQQVIGIESDVSDRFQRIETSQHDLARKIDEIGAKFAAGSSTDWKALSGWAAVMILLGGALYWPINQQSADHKLRIDRIEQNYVPEKFHDRIWATWEQRWRDSNNRIEKNQENLFTKEQGLNLQRQIDEIRKEVGGVVTARDVLQGLERKVDRLEGQVGGRGSP